MSCLTRQLQSQLERFLCSHKELTSAHSADSLRNLLVEQGLCPSDVTCEQLRMLIKRVDQR